MSNNDIQELVDIFRRRAKRHKMNAQSKDGKAVKNYHLGYADSYEVAADHLESSIKDE
ncbi:hypothetical protein M196_gp34 [Halorubrum tailed virus 4]|uniref:Uncharacterized protein n=1 Tax=Halorubrum tailed virus 4 TaxID=1273752 RepID=R4TFX6_9CAUD|nr:hypothetical protein M196_gp34 [Halorubrum tailed virus 4]AGM11126.1 hypothetical protein HRTV4_33 [Halorubrum tailed virus 4]